MAKAQSHADDAVRRLVWYRESGVALESRPSRGLFASEVRLSVIGCGLCGSDLHLIDGHLDFPSPRPLGHETVGRVAEVGGQVRGLEVGDIVCVEPSIPCNDCWFCRSGIEGLCEARIRTDAGFADEMILPARALHPVPAEVDPRHAVLAEPLSCVLQGIERTDLKPGGTVAIVGGGTMGMLSVLLARQMGASQVILITRSAWKLELGARLGATTTIDASAPDAIEQARAATGGRGPDIAIEAAGVRAAVEQSIELPRRGGTVLLLGAGAESITVSPTDVMMRDLTIRGSFVRNINLPRAIELLRVLDVEPLLTQEVTLDRFEEGLDLMRTGKAIKVVVTP
jgi:threonine dehydrogenase-like Zn-dependent dehydrogenase